jgi:hypothetical protein
MIDLISRVKSLLLGSSALVISNDAPQVVKNSAKLAKMIWGDLIQVCESATNNHVEIEAASATGRNVQLGPGGFSVGDGTLMGGVLVSCRMYPNMTIEGCGRRTTVLTFDGTAAGGLGTDNAVIGVFYGQGPGAYEGVAPPTYNCRVAHLGIDMNSKASRGVEFKSARDVEVEDVEVWGFTSFAVIAAQAISIGISAFADADYDAGRVVNCKVTGDNTALGVGPYAFIVDGQRVGKATFSECKAYTTHKGFAINDGAQNVTLENPYAYGCATSGIAGGAPIAKVRKYSVTVIGGQILECGATDTDNAVDAVYADVWRMVGTSIGHSGATPGRGVHVQTQCKFVGDNLHVWGHDVNVSIRNSAMSAIFNGGLFEQARGIGIDYRATVTHGAWFNGVVVLNNGLDTSKADTNRAGVHVAGESGLHFSGTIEDNSPSITANFTAGALAGQPVIPLDNPEDCFPYQLGTITEGATTEDVQILSIHQASGAVTLTANLVNAYTVAATFKGRTSQTYPISEDTSGENWYGPVTCKNNIYGRPAIWPASKFDGEIEAEWPYTSGLFNAAALTASVNWWQQPANAILESAQVLLRAQFVAAGMTDLDVTIGDAGNNAGILNAAMNLTSDAVGSVYVTKGAYFDATVGLLYEAAATQWIIYAVAVGANLNTLSAGKIATKVKYKQL